MSEVLDGIGRLDLTAYVRPGDTAVWGQACAEPLTLTERLIEQRAAIGGFRCFLGVTASGTIRPEHGDHVSFLSYCGSGGNRALHRAGVLDILPCHYSTLPDLIESGTLPVDVALVQLPPADAAGRHSLGLADDYLSAAIDRARVVIAEVNDQVPWTYGTRTLTGADLDVIVYTSRPPAEILRSEPGDAERRVAGRVADHVADLIEDGATLQLGLGALPEAIVARLAGRRDLGVHSGLIGDAVADLMEAGVITGARKTFDRGRTVTGALMGTSRLFGYAHRNPAIELRDTRRTHDPEVLAAHDRFVAINSAIEVDLSGQVNAEVAAGSYVGAVGGAADFLRGAARSRGGLPIVALTSTAKTSTGTVSRIVAKLSGPVSTSRADAGLIVTEYGVADLRGQPLEERRARMIAIAHPDHRPALEKECSR
ncbi:acetyl-CoA hydrolase/transferase C-terminal domain-containing protein [Microtetraspora sp. NBRC 16547]|uniref:acetyl-CoA hydrolase/transferase family protein n=1 Tax=Microtetraspora sp. NBRC 16547 TaxID=3030993 RepID=UPI0024A30DA0|nr:acetyl-CoA hydrolase/transferase C-terminal domain-containing protein [Microtetraspora sp. NBRC 16547]GLX02879.1 acetyl-CoA hydrolase [Microtetraspora sp. NBRC 16547]